MWRVILPLKNRLVHGLREAVEEGPEKMSEKKITPKRAYPFEDAENKGERKSVEKELKADSKKTLFFILLLPPPSLLENHPQERRNGCH